MLNTSKLSKVLAIVVILVVLILVIGAVVGRNVDSSNQSANIFYSIYSYFFGTEEFMDTELADRCKDERDSCISKYQNDGSITEAQRSLFIEEICRDSYDQCIIKEEIDNRAAEKKQNCINMCKGSQKCELYC